MTRLTVREIESSDHPRVGRLLVDAYDAVGRFTDEYRNFLADPARWVPGATAVFVAERHGEVHGVVAFTRPGDEEFEDMRPPVADAGFRFLAVDPDSQRTGTGRALVRECIDEARRHGARRIVVHSMWFMTGAHHLYEREGFARRPDLDVRFPSGVGYAFQLDLTEDAADRFPPPGPVPDEPPWYEDVFGDGPQRVSDQT